MGSKASTSETAGVPSGPSAMARLLPALLLFALLPAWGCDSVDSLLGEFRGARGVDAAPETVEGEAIYTVVETSAGPRFVLGLFVDGVTENSRNDYDYVVFRLDGDRPDVGAYRVDALANGPRVVTATLARVDDAGDTDDARGAILSGTDGLLSISRVDSYGFLLGSFDVQGSGLRVDRPGVRVRGEANGRFEARYESPAVFQRLGIAL